MRRRFADHRGGFQWIIAYAVALHVIWGALLLASNDPIHATPVASIALVFNAHHFLTGLVFLLIAGLAGYGLFLGHGVDAIMLIVPQQIALMLSAGGAVAAVVNGHYADGTVVPQLHILADQLPSILGSIAHSAAMLDMYRLDETR